MHVAWVGERWRVKWKYRCANWSILIELYVLGSILALLKMCTVRVKA